MGKGTANSCGDCLCAGGSSSSGCSCVSCDFGCCCNGLGSTCNCCGGGLHCCKCDTCGCENCACACNSCTTVCTRLFEIYFYMWTAIIGLGIAVVVLGVALLGNFVQPGGTDTMAIIIGLLPEIFAAFIILLFGIALFCDNSFESQLWIFNIAFRRIIYFIFALLCATGVGICAWRLDGRPRENWMCVFIITKNCVYLVLVIWAWIYDIEQQHYWVGNPRYVPPQGCQHPKAYYYDTEQQNSADVAHPTTQPMSQPMASRAPYGGYGAPNTQGASAYGHPAPESHQVQADPYGAASSSSHQPPPTGGPSSSAAVDSHREYSQADPACYEAEPATNDDNIHVAKTREQEESGAGQELDGHEGEETSAGGGGFFSGVGKVVSSVAGAGKSLAGGLFGGGSRSPSPQPQSGNNDNDKFSEV